MMLNSIFSMFDPFNKINNPFLITYFMYMYFMYMSEFNFKKSLNMMNMIKKTMLTQMNQNLENKKSKMFEISLYKTFMMMVFFNMMSLTPMSWAMTAQLAFNMSAILTIYMIIISMTKKKFKNFLIHLTPSSTPNMLIPFMIMIELVSWMARPITLILRLTANMTSGHILLLLIYKPSIFIKFPFSMFIMLAGIPMIILEIMVALIQAYILMTLLTLYMKEI